MNNNSGVVNIYEIMVIIKSTIDEKTIDAEIDKLKKLFINVIHTDNLGKRELSYQIKKENYGYYYVIQGEANSKTIVDFKTNLRFNSNLIRAMIINITKEKHHPLNPKEIKFREYLQRKEQSKKKID